jgi:hypothetical protein
MQCPFCDKSISAAARYCPHCGKKVDVTFEEISGGMVRQDKAEKLQDKVRESRRVLGIAVFVLVLMALVYVAIPAPHIPEVMPVYHVDVPAVEGVYVAQPETPVLPVPE